MKKNTWKRITLIFAMTLLFTGCGQEKQQDNAGQGSTADSNISNGTETNDGMGTDSTTAGQESLATELIVRFGDGGAPFTMHLYGNETAAAIARHVGSSDWRLPIYHYDDYENWEVMQYYDIASRYEIPSNPESITSEKAGEVYYSEPNRIILFYQDAEVAGEYTPVGYFDYSEEFVTAVEENPVLEGWGNKIVQITDSE